MMTYNKIKERGHRKIFIQTGNSVFSEATDYIPRDKEAFIDAK